MKSVGKTITKQTFCIFAKTQKSCLGNYFWNLFSGKFIKTTQFQKHGFELWKGVIANKWKEFEICGCFRISNVFIPKTQKTKAKRTKTIPKSPLTFSVDSAGFISIAYLHGAADKVTDPLVSEFLYEKACSKDKTQKIYDEGYLHSGRGTWWQNIYGTEWYYRVARFSVLA